MTYIPQKCITKHMLLHIWGRNMKYQHTIFIVFDVDAEFFVYYCH